MHRSEGASPARSLLGDPIPPALARRLRAGFAGELVRARLHGGLLARILTSLAGADAIVFGRRVFLSRPAAALVASGAVEGARLIAHELVHVRQYRRCGAAAFLGSYVGEYLGRRLAGASHAQAYRELSFEREAEEFRLASEQILEIGDGPADLGENLVAVEKSSRDQGHARERLPHAERGAATSGESPSGRRLGG